MGRGITLFAGLWTFVALPSLCTAGVLVHPCDCETPAGCSHEAECSDDPCNAVTPPREDSPSDQLATWLVEVCASAVTVHAETAQWRTPIGFLSPDLPAAFAGPWSFLSDVPLLI